MGALTKLTDAEVQAIAEEVLGRELKDFGFERAEAESGHDQEGDQAIFVTLVMQPDSAIIPGDRLSHAHVALLTSLMGRDEDRFAHLNFDWPGEEIPASPDVPL